MRHKKKILIVDDDEVLLKVTKELLELEERQYEITTHHTGVGVLNLVCQLRPDLVLLDINMPGLSGDRLTDILKPYCESNRTRIVFYSSNDEDSLREAARTNGVAGYICKGNVPDLLSKVDEYLNVRA